MKKVSYFLVIAIFLLCITSCTVETPNTPAGVPITPAGTPKPNPEFTNDKELKEWIKNVSIEDFEGGQYSKGLSSLRDCGKLLMPYFKDIDEFLLRIEIFPDTFHPSGKTAMGFYYYMRTKTVLVWVNEDTESIRLT